MEEHEIELSIGDVLQVGAYMVTVVDIDDGNVSFRVDSDGGEPVLTESVPFLIRPH